jgi:hypothetical protein
VGVVLTAPLPRASERRTETLLKKAVRYLDQIDRVFTRFARSVRFPVKDPAYPLVMLIFETDSEFEKYTATKTRQATLSAGRIAGFYSQETNYLAIRMSECQDFATPLHEAIHQQCFNRGVLQRFAPIPVWFGEGIATAFEGDGMRVSVGPSKINPRYAQQAVARKLLRWEDIVTKDAAFRGDVLAGDAYTQAWCLHWLLVTKHKDEYADFLKMLSKREPLAAPDPDSRTARFAEIFDAPIGELEGSFPQILRFAMKRQHVPLQEAEPQPGLSETDSNLAHVELKAIGRAGGLEVEGRILNTSPIRPMTYHITVETNAGTYAEWFVPDLKIGGRVPLRKQFAQKMMRGGRGGPASSFHVRVRTVVPESREAKQWKAGDLPVPAVGK